MPIFDYQCTRCGSHYDIFHKVHEILSDVICPSCGATDHKRLMSAPNVNVGGKSSSQASPCDTNYSDGCCGGMCNMN